MIRDQHRLRSEASSRRGCGWMIRLAMADGVVLDLEAAELEILVGEELIGTCGIIYHRTSARPICAVRVAGTDRNMIALQLAAMSSLPVGLYSDLLILYDADNAFEIVIDLDSGATGGTGRCKETIPQALCTVLECQPDGQTMVARFAGTCQSPGNDSAFLN